MGVIGQTERSEVSWNSSEKVCDSSGRGKIELLQNFNILTGNKGERNKK